MKKQGDKRFAEGYRMGLRHAIVALRRKQKEMGATKVVLFMQQVERDMIDAHDEEADCWGEPHVQHIVAAEPGR